MNFFYKCSSSPYAEQNSNPDPSNYKILDYCVIKNNLLLVIKYPNCTNYEGLKLLLYKNINSIKLLLNLTDNKLDPHFFESTISPFARFKPDAEGVAAAKILANII